MQFMVATSGLNSYAHLYLLPSGRMFVQANYSTSKLGVCVVSQLSCSYLGLQCKCGNRAGGDAWTGYPGVPSVWGGGDAAADAWQQLHADDVVLRGVGYARGSVGELQLASDQYLELPYRGTANASRRKDRMGRWGGMCRTMRCSRGARWGSLSCCRTRRCYEWDRRVRNADGRDRIWDAVWDEPGCRACAHARDIRCECGREFDDVHGRTVLPAVFCKHCDATGARGYGGGVYCVAGGGIVRGRCTYGGLCSALMFVVVGGVPSMGKMVTGHWRAANTSRVIPCPSRATLSSNGSKAAITVVIQAALMYCIQARM